MEFFSGKICVGGGKIEIFNIPHAKCSDKAQELLSYFEEPVIRLDGVSQAPQSKGQRGCLNGAAMRSDDPRSLPDFCDPSWKTSSD
jgi:hypothetical protein